MLESSFELGFLPCFCIRDLPQHQQGRFVSTLGDLGQQVDDAMIPASLFVGFWEDVAQPPQIPRCPSAITRRGGFIPRSLRYLSTSDQLWVDSRILTFAPLAAGFTWTHEEVCAAQNKVLETQSSTSNARESGARFFTPCEYRTVRVLVDLIIPKDEHSGSATAAGVHQFIDFMMVDQPSRQTAMRGGLA